ncbi:hypothetical protein BBP40_001913 [Aspergillus hancockii]|nr:hypothetical protein BBP40_001913 [Aspergillus hancockii]
MKLIYRSCLIGPPLDTSAEAPTHPTSAPPAYTAPRTSRRTQSSVLTASFATKVKSTDPETVQEYHMDSATVQALLCTSSPSLTDFPHIMIMRPASNFDQPHNHKTILQHLEYSDTDGFVPSVQYLHNRRY